MTINPKDYTLNQQMILMTIYAANVSKSKVIENVIKCFDDDLDITKHLQQLSYIIKQRPYIRSTKEFEKDFLTLFDYYIKVNPTRKDNLIHAVYEIAEGLKIDKDMGT